MEKCVTCIWECRRTDRLRHLTDEGEEALCDYPFGSLNRRKGWTLSNVHKRDLHSTAKHFLMDLLCVVWMGLFSLTSAVAVITEVGP